MKNTGNMLVAGLERLGLITSHIRQSKGEISKIEIDIILQELRDLYVEALQLQAQMVVPAEPEALVEESPIEENPLLVEESAVSVEQVVEFVAIDRVEEEVKPEPEVMDEPEPVVKVDEAQSVEPTFAPEEVKEVVPAAAVMKELETDNEDLFANDALSLIFEPVEDTDPIVEPEPALALEEIEAPAEEEPAMAPAEEELIATPAEEEPVEALAKEEPIAAPVEEEPVVAPAESSKVEERQSRLFDYLSTPESAQPQPQTIADKLRSNTNQNQFETTVSRNKVSDLRTVININDKFSFMSELFHNNMKAYNDFILHLNALEGREEAEAYVHEISQQYSWEENSLAVKSFFKIFDRKF